MSEEWKITSDGEADWALKQIKASEEEYERIKKIADEQIDGILSMLDDHKKTYENETAYLKMRLEEYFNTVPHKKTKTQESYKLLSGSLARKNGTDKYERDDGVLLTYLEENYPCYIKTEQKVMWADLKKDISVIDGKAYHADTGEEIPGITVEKNPDTFEVKWKR